MNSFALEILLPFVKILLGFVICTIISVACLYAAFIGFLVSVDFLMPGKPLKGLPILFAGGLIGILTFPLGAWFLREDLRAITPGWLFPDALVYLFGSSLIFLFALVRIYARIAKYRRNWHPQNGEQKKYYKTGELWSVRNWKDGELHGETLYFCPDGRIYYKANYECGMMLGEIYETHCNEFDTNKTVSFYEPAGKLISKKKYYRGTIREEWIIIARKTRVRYYAENGDLLDEQII